MGCFEGVVPKYLMIYSIVKILVDLLDFKNGVFRDLDSKFHYLEVAKFLVILFRILGVRHIRKRIQFNLAIFSILLETVIFCFQNQHFRRLRLYVELVFGCITLMFLVFFHPSYCVDSKHPRRML